MANSPLPNNTREKKKRIYVPKVKCGMFLKHSCLVYNANQDACFNFFKLKALSSPIEGFTEQMSLP